VVAMFFLGVIDTSARSLTYGNAGHPAPLVISATSEDVARLAPSDPEPAAGLLGDFVYSRQACEFRPGDLFFGYTDGVLEAGDGNGGMFGEDRLRDVLTANRGCSGDEV